MIRRDSKTDAEKTDVDFKAKKLISVKIWKNLKNKDKKYVLEPLNKLSDEQSEELETIQEDLKNCLDRLDLKTNNHSISKAEFGYKFSRKCKKCLANINLKLDIKDGTGKISFYEKCKYH